MSLNLDTGPSMPPIRLWHTLARPTGLVLSPLLLAQGRRARSKRGRLPNAPLPWSGTINGPNPIRLVGLGDSTIAGVGVDDPMLGLSSQISRELYRHTHRGVVWDSYGERGITTGPTPGRLPPASAGRTAGRRCCPGVDWRERCQEPAVGVCRGEQHARHRRCPPRPLTRCSDRCVVASRFSPLRVSATASPRGDGSPRPSH